MTKVQSIAGNYRERYLKILQFFLTLAVTTVFFVFFWRRIDISATIVSIKNADISFLIVAIATSFIMTVVLAPLQWKFLLEAFNCHIGFWESLFIKLSVTPLKGLFPLKSGELFRCGYLHQRHGTPMIQSLKAVAVNLTLNLILLVIFSAVGAVVNRKQVFLYRFVLAAIMLGIIMIAVVAHWYILHKNYYGKKFFDKIIYTIVFFQSSQTTLIAKIVILSLAIELSELIAFFWICRSLQLNVSFSLILFLLPLAIIIANLPVAIFGLGTREAAILFMFFGIASQEKLLGCSLVYFCACYLLPAFIGLPCLVPFFGTLMRPRKEVIQR